MIWRASHELILHSFHDNFVSCISKQLTGRDEANILVELMKEDSHIARERDHLTERLACFKKNIPKLKEIRFADVKQAHRTISTVLVHRPESQNNNTHIWQWGLRAKVSVVIPVAEKKKQFNCEHREKKSSASRKKK